MNPGNDEAPASERQDIEVATADLFPRIHGKVTEADLESYRRVITAVIADYETRFRLPGIARGREVLEVGCGGRAAGIRVLERYQPRSITALDLSPENVEYSQEHTRRAGLANVTIQQGNALELPFPDASFDLVFSDGVIMTTPDPPRCFREMTRVLRPGGHLVLGIYGYGGLFFRTAYPILGLLRRIVPMRAMERFVNVTGIFQSQDYSILDLMYTPLQTAFPVSEVLGWFESGGFEQVAHLPSPRWWYSLGRLSRLLFGDGYIHAAGRKCGESAPPV